MSEPARAARAQVGRPEPDRAPIGDRVVGGHIPALDGVRGVAILLVMLNHFTFYGGMRPEHPVDSLYYRVATTGWVGVDLFFVLSGFLITGILLDTKGAQHYLRNFYARRTLRIFPLYYATLAFVFFMLPAIISPDEKFEALRANQLWYWTYLVNWHIAVEGWHSFAAIGHFWSLAVEEQFYLLWPIVVWLCSRRKLFAVSLAVIAGAFACRVALHLGGAPNAGYVLTLARMDSLVIGGLLALLVRRPSASTQLARWCAPLLLLAGAAVGLIAFWEGGLPAESPLVQLAGYPALALTSAALIGLVVASPGGLPVRLLAHPALTFFGRYSYGLYVIRHVVIFFIRRRGFRVEGLPTLFGSQLPGQGLYTIIAGGLSVALALLSWHLFETHFLRLKERFPYRAEAPAVEAAPSLVPERL